MSDTTLLLDTEQQEVLAQHLDVLLFALPDPEVLAAVHAALLHPQLRLLDGQT